MTTKKKTPSFPLSLLLSSSKVLLYGYPIYTFSYQLPKERRESDKKTLYYSSGFSFVLLEGSTTVLSGPIMIETSD